MSWLAARAPLPLLRKELTELAARRRTYALRVGYGAALFALFAVFSYSRIQRSAYAVAWLGIGRELFGILVGLQAAGIFFFLPPLMARAITEEKERGTLPLLLLTDLRPWEIVVQKYVSHLVPMFTCLLLSLPLLALCYAYGGLEPRDLASGIAAVFLLCLVVGAVSLACSAYCRTSMEALLKTYTMSLLVYLVLCCMGGFLVLPAPGAGTYLVAAVPAVLVVPTCLGIASGCLVSRAAVASPRPRRVRPGRPGARDGSALPSDHPIAWREVGGSRWGTLQNAWSVLVLVELPVVVFVFAILAAGVEPRHAVVEFSMMLAFIWVVLVPIVAVLSADAIPSERGRQTLDLLLATPLAAREILRQKLSVVWRVVLVSAIPFATIFVVEAWARDRGRLFYVVSSALSVGVCLPLVSWVSLWVGLRARSRARAIVAALALAAVWWLGVPLVLAASGAADAPGARGAAASFLYLVSPATMIVLTEQGEAGPFFGGSPWLPLALNYGFHGLLLQLFRSLCLGRADRYLGRAARPRGAAT